MPIESVFFLILVIGAMTVFAATLAYGEWVWKQPPSKSSRNINAAMPSKKVPAALKKAA